MSALHQACARAIANAMQGALNESREGVAGGNWVARVSGAQEPGDQARILGEYAAAAAVGVCLAEAQRAVEALPPVHENCELCAADPLLQGSAVLGALAALAEEQA